MAKLIKIVNLIYLVFLITSVLFFYDQFTKRLILEEIFVKVSTFSAGFMLVLFLTYKNSKGFFDYTLKTMKISESIAIPPIMLAFLGGFSIVLAIIFIAFLNNIGILFVVKTLQFLVLNILALISFFWLAFIFFIGWGYIKIAGVVSQYSMLRNIEAGKQANFFKSMKTSFSRLSSIRDVFLAFVAIDLSCKHLPRIDRLYYKNLLYSVKVWTACLVLYENKSVSDALNEAFEYFRTKSFKLFYTSKFSTLFLPLLLVPIGLTLSIILPNMDYFSYSQCIRGSCFFVVNFFLVFTAIGFFFAYSISMSLESAYYARVLSDIKEGNIINSFTQYKRIKFVESETHEKMSKLKGNFLDFIRIYF